MGFVVLFGLYKAGLVDRIIGPIRLFLQIGGPLKGALGLLCRGLGLM